MLNASGTDTFGLGARMGGVQPVIVFLECHQFVVSSLLDDHAVLDEHDPVDIRDGGESVADYNRRSPLRRSIEGPLHRRLAVNVQGRGRFVQQKDRWSSNQSTRNRDPLLLPARQLGSPLAYGTIVALDWRKDIITKDVIIAAQKRRVFLNLFEIK